ncbi:MAG: twin-arginine translocase TatA/TatE family subunit [Candidatus Hydrothermarchaeales archaeon]
MVFGTPEVVVILVLALVLFGPQKLPELARAIGKAVGEYNKAKGEFEKEVHKAKSDIEKETKVINTDVMVKESRQNSAEIRKIARGMGIATEAKDDSALLKEIDVRVKKKPGLSKEPTRAGPGLTKKPTASVARARPKPAASTRTTIKRKPRPKAGTRARKKPVGASKRSS